MGTGDGTEELEEAAELINATVGVVVIDHESGKAGRGPNHVPLEPRSVALVRAVGHILDFSGV